MAIAALNDWHLNDGTYTTGVNLLAEFPQHSSLMPLLRSGESSYTREKLEAAVADVLSNYHEEPVLEKDASTPDAKPANDLGKIHPDGKHKIGQIEGYPDHLVKLDRSVLMKMKKVDELRAFLYTLPDGDDLGKVALTIVALDKEVQFGFDQLNYFARTGEVMPGTGPPKSEKKMAQMMAAIKNHPPYISKFKKSDDPKVKAEVKRREKELAEAKAFMEKHL